MKLVVTKGSGTGPTKLLAFHKALEQAKISNFNLIYLSSIVPKNSTIIEEKPNLEKYEYGSKLYVVMSKIIAAQKGEEAWAGICWLQEKDGKGLFFEYTGSSKNEVENLINITFEEIKKDETKKYSHGFIINGSKCKDFPICSLVTVVFENEDWKEK